MYRKLKLLSSALVLLFVFSFSACGDSEKNTAKLLGEVWEGLKAENRDPYNSLKNKPLDVSVVFVQPDFENESKKAGSGGKVPVGALTMMESVSLSGPQLIIVMMTPEEMAAIQYDKEAPLLWGTVRMNVGATLYGTKDLLSFGLAQDAASIKLTRDEIWPIPAEIWAEPMLTHMKSLAMAAEGYKIDNNKAPENLEELYKYGYRKNQALKPELTPSKTNDGEPGFVAVVFSLDGKYKMTLNYPGYDISRLSPEPVE